MKTDVSLKIQILLLLKGWSVTGLFFLFIGLVCSFYFVSPRILNDGKLTSNHVATKGQLVDILRTPVVFSDEKIWEFIYEYQMPDNQYVTSFSFSSGFYGLEIGDSINVQYHPENPYLSRIEGMRTSKYGAGALSIWILILLGILLILTGYISARKKISMLQYGRPAWGKLIIKKNTGVSINEKPVYKLTYEFETEEKVKAKGWIKTHNTYMVTDEAYERLLYFPSKARNILLLDNQSPMVKRFMKENFPEFASSKR